MSINRNNYESYFIDYMEGTLSEEDRVAVEVFLSEHPDLALEIEDDLPALTRGNEPKIELENLKQTLVWDEEEVSVLLINRLEQQVETHDTERLNQFKGHFPEKFARLEKLIALSVAVPKNTPLSNDKKLEFYQLDLEDQSHKLVALIEGDLTEREATILKKKIAASAELGKEYATLQRSKLLASPVVYPSELKAQLKKKAGAIIPLWIKSASAVAAAVLLFIIPFAVTESEGLSEFTPRTITGIAQTSNEVAEETEFSFVTTASDNKVSKVNSVSSYIKTVSGIKVATDQNQSASPIQKRKETISRMNAVLASNNWVKPIEGAEIKGGYVKVEAPTVYEVTEASKVSADPVAALTPFEFIGKKIKEKIGKDSDKKESLALTAVNNAAKKFSDKKEDLVTYKKPSEESSGFKFKLGKFSVESNK